MSGKCTFGVRISRFLIPSVAKDFERLPNLLPKRLGLLTKLRLQTSAIGASNCISLIGLRNSFYFGFSLPFEDPA